MQPIFRQYCAASSAWQALCRLPADTTLRDAVSAAQYCDDLPAYGEGEPTISGDRKHRGLYISKDGFAVNADVNGSLNIGRKVIPEFQGIGDRSLAARPVVINPLKA